MVKHNSDTFVTLQYGKFRKSFLHNTPKGVIVDALEVVLIQAWVRRVNCLKIIDSYISANTQPIALKFSWTIVFRKNFYLMVTMPRRKVTCRVM